VSNSDIPPGVPWFDFIIKQLNDAKFGIICLTKENFDNQYILFEAGAIAKTVDKEPFVCPYLIDHTLREFQSLPAPLTQFQAKRANEKGTWGLILALNNSLDKDQLSKDRLKKAFELWWPFLKSTLDSLLKIDELTLSPRIKGSSFLVSKFNKDYKLKIFELNRDVRESEDERLDLTWETFGAGCEHLAARLKKAPGGICPDIFFGINSAGIMIAAYLSDFYRAPLGIIKTEIEISGHRSIRQFEFPKANVKNDDKPMIEGTIVKNPKCIAVVDSEIKSGKSVKDIIDILENRYTNARIIYIVLGGVVRPEDWNNLNINSFGWDVDQKYKPDFLAFYIDLPGFDPPGGIR
jgi:hypoxanthine phosphoribosyltransferase